MKIPKIALSFKKKFYKKTLLKLPKGKAFILKYSRILFASLKILNSYQYRLRASALTFYSFLTVVPIFAMIFGITKGFGYEKILQEQLYDKLKGQDEIAKGIIDFSNMLLENVKGGVIAGIGILILFWTIIKVLSNIEDAFNEIWSIKESRSLGRKISDYLSLMVIFPSLMVISSASTVLITSKIEVVLEHISTLRTVSPVIIFMLNLLPYGALWILLTYLYIFMPNTKVNFISGALAGVITGTIYQIFQWGYIYFQIGVSQYNAIYGGFAAIPMFLIWLQLSWMLILFGAQISFAHQNADYYKSEGDYQDWSHFGKNLLSLGIVRFLVKHFSDDSYAWDTNRISRELKIPVAYIDQAIQELIEADLIVQISRDGAKKASYQPARDPELMTIKYVTNALEKKGNNTFPLLNIPGLKEIEENLRFRDKLLEKSSANILLKDI